MSRLCLAQLTVDPVSIPELIASAAQAGFDAINPRIRATTDKGPSRIDVADIKKRTRDEGLSVLALTSFWIMPETNPADFESIADAAAALDCRFVQSVINDPDEGRALANFSRVCEIAAERDVTMAIEFLGYVTVPSLKATDGFITASGQPNAGICLDALALARAGETPADIARIDRNRISYVQLCDGAKKSPPREDLRNEARARRLYPGDGELWLGELLDALPPDIPIDIEAPVEADAALPPLQKAKKAADKTRAFLAKHQSRRGQP